MSARFRTRCFAVTSSLIAGTQASPTAAIQRTPHVRHVHARDHRRRGPQAPPPTGRAHRRRGPQAPPPTGRAHSRRGPKEPLRRKNARARARSLAPPRRSSPASSPTLPLSAVRRPQAPPNAAARRHHRSTRAQTRPLTSTVTHRHRLSQVQPPAPNARAPGRGASVPKRAKTGRAHKNVVIPIFY